MWTNCWIEIEASSAADMEILKDTSRKTESHIPLRFPFFFPLHPPNIPLIQSLTSNNISIAVVALVLNLGIRMKITGSRAFSAILGNWGPMENTLLSVPTARPLVKDKKKQGSVLISTTRPGRQDGRLRRGGCNNQGVCSRNGNSLRSVLEELKRGPRFFIVVAKRKACFHAPRCSQATPPPFIAYCLARRFWVRFHQSHQEGPFFYY